MITRSIIQTTFNFFFFLFVYAFQAKFRKMVDENKQLVSRIEDEIQNAHEEVNDIRDELAETNKRLEEHINSKLGGENSTENAANSADSASTTSPGKTKENQNCENSIFSKSEIQKDGNGGGSGCGGKPNTNPFAGNFDSANETIGKINFFNQKKGTDFFAGKHSDSSGFFSGNFTSSNKKSDAAEREKLEFLGNSDKLFEGLEKKENFFSDCIASKIFKSGLETNQGIKPEDFVVTSNLKLNFLTKSTENGKKNLDKSTGAVPKRSKHGNDDNGGKNDETSARNSDLDSATKPNNQNIHHFVRPLSPLPANQGEF